MKSQASCSSKDKSKILKCHLLQFLFGALRVSMPPICLPKFLLGHKNGYFCGGDVGIARFPFIDWGLLISGLTFDKYIF